MKILEQEGLTFDDVLLVPQRTSLTSRKEAIVSTQLTKKISLQIPIVSSNMDTVTESSMAIALARLGGIGIIHRYLTIEDEVAEVLKVKRSESIVIDKPYTIGPNETVESALLAMKDWGVSGFPVIDTSGVLLGLLTTRDTLFAGFPAKVKVSEVMTKKKDLVTGTPGISSEEARKLLEANRLEKLPLVDAGGKLQGLITVKDLIEKKIQYPNSIKDTKGRLLVGAAIGVKGDYMERSQALIEAGADALVLDIAHGHATYAIDVIRQLKSKFGDAAQIIAGNVATYEGAADLVDAGADAIKVGVGPGATCTTRIVTGSGVPQLTAIMEASKITKEKGVPVIADGGIRNSGDVVKALAAGASTVMVGSMLAGTEESPGSMITRDGMRYKICRGMASLGAAFGRAKRTGENFDDDDIGNVTPEGVEALVPYRGSCNEVIHLLVGGLRSGLSYCGSRTIMEMWDKAVFMRMSQASFLESRPHDLAKP